MLAERQIRAGTPEAALETARAYSARFPDNYILGMLHAKALLANGRYPESAAKLAGLNVIPYEGSIEGRRLYRETHLMLAVASLKKGDAAAAQREVDRARLWPENLGAGKPYPENVDERLEDWLAAQCLAPRGRTAEARALLQQAAGSAGSRPGAGTLVRALALRQAGRDGEGRQLVADWAAREPQSALAAWATRAYAGDVGPVPEAGGEEARVLAAWLAGERR
jgi:predicted Zn-dependent protease